MLFLQIDESFAVWHLLVHKASLYNLGISYFNQEESMEFDFYFPKDRAREIVEGMLGI